MNIYALRGHKVLVTKNSILNGSTGDKTIAKINLKIDEEYTVKKTIVEGWRTSVYLLEFPSKVFNSVNFIDKESQSIKSDKRHKNYTKN